MNEKINFQDYIYCKKTNKISCFGENIYNLYTLYYDKTIRQDIVDGTKTKIIRWINKNFPNFDTKKLNIQFLSIGDSMCLIGKNDGHETYKTYDHRL